ncbi:uncharacterized protein LOC132279433 isoform X2 [Cornus florida]|uniref:uncharacterized protein LOC132279433 isoform X2 n=1 Tax=Cornus florida TaxID=4283 RepID=UPI00289CC9DF|nr:uncharacterized protein LOC132279433 isoform X2 [Cornus florida]
MQCATPVMECRLFLGIHSTENKHKLRPTNLSNSSTFKTLSRKLNTRIHQLNRKVHRISYRSSPVRGILNFAWSRTFSMSWTRASRIISVYLFCLNLVAEARDDPYSSLAYACEDVQIYYDGVEHLRGEALKKKLNSIIGKHRSLSYNKVWDALKILDAADVDKPEASSEIVEIYSLRAVSKHLAGKPEGWNREHLWPRSYGLTNGPSLTDLHNIRPADVNVNSSRGNKYYGECRINSSHCLKPATKEAASDTETDKKRWAPPVQVRGDIARALMYMAVCYGFHPSGEGHDLHLSDSPSIANKEMGLLSTLLKWNEIDLPSREEKLRNERICRFYQHNRNPFVDHPEYANLIWEQVVPSRRGSYTTSRKAWINESHYHNKGRDQNEFVEIVVGQSTNAAELELAFYNGSNGKIYSSLPWANNKGFHLTDGGSGFLIYTAALPIQNGPADGIALLSIDDNAVEVVDFDSYAGTVKAVDGPAMGNESVDIGVKETEGSSKNDSLGLAGVQVGVYNWKKFVGGASPGKLNVGQNLSVHSDDHQCDSQ